MNHAYPNKPKYCFECLGKPLRLKCSSCFESTSKCFCPFCGDNLYTIDQMEKHISGKMAWAVRSGNVSDHQELKISHSGRTSIILINREEPMCNQFEDAKLEAKFDALTKHLGVEFVFETVSDENGEETKVFARKKTTKKP